MSKKTAKNLRTSNKKSLVDSDKILSLLAYESKIKFTDSDIITTLITGNNEDDFCYTPQKSIQI